MNLMIIVLLVLAMPREIENGAAKLAAAKGIALKAASYCRLSIYHELVFSFEAL